MLRSAVKAVFQSLCQHPAVTFFAYAKKQISTLKITAKKFHIFQQ
jgi:hypothetical protein